MTPSSLLALRCRLDFEFWARVCCVIKDKTSGKDGPFILNGPQRRVLAILEADRLAGRPMRLIMLKARQWGGSTLILCYMAWLQSCVFRNWNAIICSQVKDTSSIIRGMYSKILRNYPASLWEGDAPPAFRNFEGSRNTTEITGRGCRVTIASISNYDNVRGSDFAMAHLSETAFWKNTKSKSPDDLVRSICSSVAVAPGTLIAMESTANGVGNFFHREWQRSVDGSGDKRPVFIPWFEIDAYSAPVTDPDAFSRSLSPYECMLRDVFGCSLEQICWYRKKLSEYSSHVQMMSEYPSTPAEAFTGTGNGIFAPAHIDALRDDCTAPLLSADLVPSSQPFSDADSSGCQPPVAKLRGPGIKSRIYAKHRRPTTPSSLPTSARWQASTAFSLNPNPGGRLKIWQHPLDDARYIVAVDIGGRTDRADFSVIAVMRADGPKPEIVAQWRGHIDHDILARYAEFIARRYNNALLAIESNSLENSGAGQYILTYLRGAYPRLYNRPGGRPGFHTNTATKQMAIVGLIAAVRDHAYIERDEEVCKEYLAYRQTPQGSYEARPGSHDDILMTRAIALLILSLISKS